mgnify:CR=1 FL=1
MTNGDVHQAAELRIDSAAEHLGGIQEVIHDLCLLLVDVLHGSQAAEALEVLEDLAADIDGPAVRRVIHGAASAWVLYIM